MNELKNLQIIEKMMRGISTYYPEIDTYRQNTMRPAIVSNTNTLPGFLGNLLIIKHRRTLAETVEAPITAPLTLTSKY